MQLSQMMAPARLGALFLLLGCGPGLDAIAADRCVKVKFFDGKAIAVQSTAVKHLNALLEWPSMRKVFGISMVPPPGDIAADVSSIVVEPVSTEVPDRRKACDTRGDGPVCERFLVLPDISASVYFTAGSTQSRESVMTEVRDYLDKQVQACL